MNMYVAADDDADVAADCDCDIRVLCNKWNVLPPTDGDVSDESGIGECFLRVVHSAFHILSRTVDAVAEFAGCLENPSTSKVDVVDSYDDGGKASILRSDIEYGVIDDLKRDSSIRCCSAATSALSASRLL